MKFSLLFIFFSTTFVFGQRDFKFENGGLFAFPKDSILKLKHPELNIKTISNYTKFDTNYTENYDSDDKSISEFGSFSEKFKYLKTEKSGNKTYCFALNNLGFWLLEKDKNTINPYFLGVAKDRFLHLKISKKYKLINNGKVQLECSIVRAIKPKILPDEPFQKYEALKDNLLLEIEITKLKMDSDKDGLTDIFEKYVGLNPNYKDSDNDGIDDNIDKNPLYKSTDNEFTEAFNVYLNGDFTVIIPQTNYEHFQKKEENSNIGIYDFEIYFVENEVLKNINPTAKKILIFKPEEIQKKNNFKVVEKNFYNIEKSKDNQGFIIHKSFDIGSSTSKIYNEKGKWFVTLIGATVS